jgi:hypothetical protein
MENGERPDQHDEGDDDESCHSICTSSRQRMR